MIESIHQIDFISSAGTIRLLDIGAIVEEMPKIDWKQRTQENYPILSPWAEGQALGGASVAVSWTAVRSHSSHADVQSLRITISGGETWDIQNATIISSSPQPLMSSAGFESVTSYQASGARTIPATSLTLFEGIPWDWTLQNWDAVTNQWQSL
jgi:hypothetical protein